MPGCSLSRHLFSHSVSEKTKVISEKSIFFVNHNSWNQYNYFLFITFFLLLIDNIKFYAIYPQEKVFRQIRAEQVLTPAKFQKWTDSFGHF